MKRAGILVCAAFLSCASFREKPCANPDNFCDPNALMLFGLLLQPSTRYLAVLGTSALALYSVDPSSGRLTAVSIAGSGISNARVVVYNAAFSHLYVINQGTAAVSVYRLDTASGSLSLLQNATIAAAGMDAALEPGGRLLFVTTGVNGIVSTLAASASGLSQVSVLNTGAPVSAVGVHSSSQSVFVNQDTLGLLRRSTYDSSGTLTPADSTTACPGSAYAAYASPFLFLSCSVSNTLTAYNLTSGPAATVSSAAAGTLPSQAAVAADGSPVLAATNSFLNLFSSNRGSLTFAAASGSNSVHGGAAISLNEAFAWSARSTGVIEVTALSGDSYTTYGPDVTAPFVPAYMIPINL